MLRRIIPGCALTLLASASLGADTWTTPHPGVRHLYRTNSQPNRMHLFEVDLCAPGVSARATRPSERQRTVPGWAGDRGVEVAINADFFSYADYSTSGLSVGNGERWTDTNDGSSDVNLAFGAGRADLIDAATVLEPPEPWMREVVSGHYQLLRDGANVASGSDLCTARHPRTAIGLSRDRRTLYMLVVDGRSSVSIGATCNDLANWLDVFGAWDATNMDGGGSSTAWLRGEGTVNDPSDGSPRVVANHLGLHADGSGAPGSCERSLWEAAESSAVRGAPTDSDVDGDGVADVCARTADGFRCALSGGASGFSSEWVTGPALTGWDTPARYGSLRMADVTGDGRADVCGLDGDSVRCWPSLGDGFGEGFGGPAWGDDAGFDEPHRWGTFRLGDVDGDGLADACANTDGGFTCALAGAAGFAEPFAPVALWTGSGDEDPNRFGTIRLGDIDGDGRFDVCARRSDGMHCVVSTGAGWGETRTGPAWSDASGWGRPEYASTIALQDIDHDGRADLCARAWDGYRCHLAEGDGFGDGIVGPALSDAQGWADHANYSTLRHGDFDGDGDLDLCVRADAGLRCWLWQDGYGGDPIAATNMADENGWGLDRYYATLRMADVTGDGRFDLCARSSSGLRCYPSGGDAVAPSVPGPPWSNEAGFTEAALWVPIFAGGPSCRGRTEICNGRDDDCDGRADEGCPPLDPPRPPPDDDEGDDDSAPSPAPSLPPSSGCAGCSGSTAWAWLPLGLVGRRRRC